MCLKGHNKTCAGFLWKYKNSKGRRCNSNQKNITEYKQNTLYRTTKSGDVNRKTIYNARNNFVSESGDKRFSKNRVYDSGRLHELYQEELKFNQEFKLDTNKSELNDDIRQFVRCIYNKPDMSNEVVATCLRAYSVYKKEYLERL